MRSSQKENVHKNIPKKKRLLTTIALAGCIYLLRKRVKKAVAGCGLVDGIIAGRHNK